MEAEWSLFPVIKKRGTQKGFCAQEPHRVLLGITGTTSFGRTRAAGKEETWGRCETSLLETPLPIKSHNINNYPGKLQEAQSYQEQRVSCTDGCISDNSPGKKARQSHQRTGMEAKLKDIWIYKAVPLLNVVTKQKEDITVRWKSLSGTSQSTNSFSILSSITQFFWIYNSPSSCIANW